MSGLSRKARLREALEKLPLVGHWVRWAHRRVYWAPHKGYPRWNEILGPQAAVLRRAARTAEGQKVLVATGVGAYLAGNSLEGLLSAALTLRGAKVEALLCDKALPACFDCHMQWYPSAGQFLREGPQGRLCDSCFPLAARMYGELGIPTETLSPWILPADRDDLRRLTSSKENLKVYREEDVSIGEHALAGALRFFARATLEGEPRGEEVFQKYFEAAFLTARAARRLLAAKKYARVLLNHGIYVPQGLIGEAARSLQIPVVSWNPAYRRNSFIFSHRETYHHTLLSEPPAEWESLELSPEQDAGLTAYLKSRWRGSQDWIWFHENPRFGEDDIRAIGANPSKPWIGLLTNVLWDAQLHYPANVFPSMMDWLFQTIDYFESRPDLQLIIRIHPAEIHGTLPSRQKVADELRQRVKPLPSNVFLVGPASPVSTYALMERCNAVLIYGTKMGVELTSVGLPVVVAGEAWIRNKGLTLDAQSIAHYFGLLDRLPLAARLPEDQVRRARRYAYHFFFRRMIPLRSVQAQKGDPPFGPRHGLGLADLAPGQDAGLDVVCDGILLGTPFIFDGQVRAGEPIAAGTS